MDVMKIPSDHEKKKRGISAVEFCPAQTQGWPQVTYHAHGRMIIRPLQQTKQTLEPGRYSVVASYFPRLMMDVPPSFDQLRKRAHSTLYHVITGGFLPLFTRYECPFSWRSKTGVEEFF
jgi:hypothetical protein